MIKTYIIWIAFSHCAIKFIIFLGDDKVFFNFDWFLICWILIGIGVGDEFLSFIGLIFLFPRVVEWKIGDF